MSETSSSTGWKWPFEVPDSSKVTIASTCNFVLLVLLRFNRIIVPIVYRWLKNRRSKWISRIPDDVARELRRRPDQRQLCAGECCKSSYYGSMASEGANDTSVISSRSIVPSVQHWISAIMTEYNPLSKGDDETASRGVGMKEEEIYFRVRVIQEERHRGQKRNHFMIPDALFRYYTLITLTLYSTIIITVVLHMFEYSVWEALWFSFTLVSSGVISEWSVLWPSRDGPPVWMTRFSSEENV